MTTYSAVDTSVDQLKSKIQQRTARVGIIGLGYVGLPLALLYSEQKFRVTGFDIDQRKVETLAKGGTYIVRITPEEIKAGQKHGFTATSDYSQLSDMDAVIICVPTPLNEYHEPDLSYITDTTHSIAPHLRAGQLVVLESTTYPGTTEEVMIPILEKENKGGLKAARDGALFRRILAGTRRSRQHQRCTTRYPEGDWRSEPAGLGTRRGAVRRHLQPHCAGLLSGCCGNDQAA